MAMKSGTGRIEIETEAGKVDKHSGCQSICVRVSSCMVGEELSDELG